MLLKFNVNVSHMVRPAIPVNLVAPSNTSFTNRLSRLFKINCSTILKMTSSPYMKSESD